MTLRYAELLDARAKDLDPTLWAYKLQTPNVAGYGMDAVFSNDMEIDESKMMVSVPYADGSNRDGVGDLLEVGGINTSRHRLSPIVYFDHAKQHTLPIGLSQDPDTQEYTNYIDPVSRRAWVKAFFYQGNKKFPALRKDGTDGNAAYDHALFCEQLFDLVAKRYIRGGSIGYQVIHAKQLQPDYERGVPQGLHLLSVLMLEASIVVMPANKDTVRKGLGPDIREVICRGESCGKPLSPVLVKSLSVYVPEKKALVQSGYAKPTPVPLQKLPKTKIPPAKWKPGVGATAGKSQVSNKGDLPNVDQIKRLLRQKGIDVLAVTQDGYSKKLKVMVPHRDTSKAEDAINESGWRTSVTVHGGDKTLEGKNMSAALGDTKSLHAIRLKYRQAKKNRGKKTKQKVTPGSEESHAVSGPEGESLTKKSGGEKTLKGGKKSAPRRLEAKGKALPLEDPSMDPGMDPAADPMADPMMDPSMKQESLIETPDEVYSAQFLRMMHQDHQILIDEYHKGARLLEHPEIRAFVEYVLGDIDGLLSKIENLFANHHSDLPPLEGAMDKEFSEFGDENLDMPGEEGLEGLDEEMPGEEGLDEEMPEGLDEEIPSEEGGDETADEAPEESDEEAVEAAETDSTDDREEEEPSGDDIVEGMKTKNLKKAKVKCASCGNPSCKCDKCMKYPNLRKPGPCPSGSREGSAAQVAKEKLSELKEEERLTDVGEDRKKRRGDKGLDGDMAETTDSDNPYSVLKKGLEANEVQTVKDAAKFLDSTSKNMDWQEDHRHEAFHHSKLLGTLSDAKRLLGTKSIPGDKEWLDEEADEHLHPHRKSCKGASSFLSKLAREKAFGDMHRDAASYHYKALSDIYGGDKDPGEQETKDMEEMPTEEKEMNTEEQDTPNDSMGEIGEKDLWRTLFERESLLESMQRSIEALANN